jgi:hypothetical protein
MLRQKNQHTPARAAVFQYTLTPRLAVVAMETPTESISPQISSYLLAVYTVVSLGCLLVVSFDLTRVELAT